MGLEDWGIHELWRHLKADPRHEKTLEAMRRRLNSDKGDVYLGNFLSVRWNFGLMGACLVTHPARSRTARGTQLALPF